MTVWLCDRCGKQTGRMAQGAGKYFIQKTIFDTGTIMNYRDGVAELHSNSKRQRAIRLCDECSMKIEQLLDDEFSAIPTELTVSIDRRN